ncbi:MAG: hypothetical protein HRT82_08930 [Henriciella sp.]|nr:hypothetical protein [Henriciella sp.]
MPTKYRRVWMPVTPREPALAFLSNENVMARWGVKKTKFFEMKKADGFPSAVMTPFGPRYRISDIAEYENSWPDKMQGGAE